MWLIISVVGGAAIRSVVISLFNYATQLVIFVRILEDNITCGWRLPGFSVNQIGAFFSPGRQTFIGIRNSVCHIGKIVVRYKQIGVKTAGVRNLHQIAVGVS